MSNIYDVYFNVIIQVNLRVITVKVRWKPDGGWLASGEQRTWLQ